jgi:glycosyltransferase involved in cell wall biosynthesis
MECNEVYSIMQQQRICVVVPAYNCEKTIEPVLKSLLQYTSDILVVDDGSTDKTAEIVSAFKNNLILLSYKDNKGKGYALTQGFKTAVQRGFRYALTLDSDGQHLPEDIATFIAFFLQQPNALLVGARPFNHPNMPHGNVFANRFSNFWFTLQTAYRLSDTQSGYRLYPLHKMKNMHAFTHRYEAELELMVRSAWKGIRIFSVPVQVHYPTKEERISHFRPKRDFIRISILNAFLCVVAVVYGYPAMFFHKMRHKDAN